MRLKYGVAIAGSHGKTTTTSLAAHLLAHAGMDPTAVVGGKVNTFGSNAKLGKGDYMVVEADESDGSFLRIPPTLAVVTNIDPEHLDYWKTPEALRQGFVDFVNRVPFYGISILCIDHPIVQSLIPDLEKRFVTYGESHQADYRADRIEVSGHSVRFDAYRRGEPLGRFEVHMVGRHNALNALAVVALADEMGIPMVVTREALASFRRRAAPLHREGREAGGHGRRRLRPPPGRGEGDAPRRPRGLPPPRRLRLPAAPLHAHARPLRGVRHRLQRRRRPPRSPTSTRPARSRSPASPRRRWSRRSGRAATATPPTSRARSWRAARARS